MSPAVTIPIDRRPLWAAALVLLAIGWAWPGASAASEPDQTGQTSASRPDDDRPVAVPEPTEKALRYYRGGNWLWLAGESWSIALPFLWLASGASPRLRNLARRLGRTWYGTLCVYLVIYLFVSFVLSLPLSYYRGFVRPHAYGLSDQTLAKWLGDHLKSLGLTMLLGGLVLWVPYGLLARRPRSWWLITGTLMLPFAFLMAIIKPVWIDPLFNDFGPMKDKALERQILDLAHRAGISGGRVFEVNKSVDTKTVNAYVTGFLHTNRIVLWDTLLAKLDPDEVLVVMGHEMGHYVLRHVERSLFLGALLNLIGLYLAHRIGGWLVARYHDWLGFRSLADVASLPLFILLFHAMALASMPLVCLYSRAQEHEADRFALEITHANHAGATAFVKFQHDNLSVPRPGWLYRTFRATHPSLGERIDFCNTYRPWRQGQPSRYAHRFRPPPDRPEAGAGP